MFWFARSIKATEPIGEVVAFDVNGDEIGRERFARPNRLAEILSELLWMSDPTELDIWVWLRKNGVVLRLEITWGGRIKIVKRRKKKWVS
jgi:hypothetical protein